MKISNTKIKDVKIIESKIIKDYRGFFTELWNSKDFKNAIGADLNFVQDNYSRSNKNVLRGLGYQIVKPQGKLVTVLKGEIYDVVVDLRRSSPNFGDWIGFELSELYHRSLWVPPGCAHGFVVKSEYADVSFKVTEYYSLQNDRCILWSDPNLAIDWGLTCDPVVSTKDLAGVAFTEAEIYP